MNKSALMVYNPNSGLGISNEILEKFKNKLNDLNYSSKLVLTKGPNDAKEIVSSSEFFDIVFSLGGDGTLNEVVNGNLKRDKQMTVVPIPTGSCNDVASMLGYGKDPIENLDLALNGNIKEVDIGTINKQAFTYVVGMGKYMHIPYETTRDVKSKLGYYAYIKEGIKEFFNSTKLYNIKVEADGIKLDGNYSLVLISNSNHIAGISGFHKDVLLDDGMFEVILCKAKSRSTLVSSFIDFYMGGKPKDFISFKANDIKLELQEKLDKSFCIDGERLDEDSLIYNINASNKMNFIVPKEKEKKLFINNI